MRLRTMLPMAALTLLLLTAGCMGLNLNDDNAAVNEYEDYPEGYDATGIDAKTAINTHANATLASESFATNQTLTMTAGELTQTVNEQRWVDVENNILRHHQSTAQYTAEEYTTSNHTSIKLTTMDQTGNETTRHQQANETFTDVEASTTHAAALEPFLGFIAFEATDVETSDDQTLITYTADSITDDTPLVGDSGAEVEESNATLVIDNEGRIHDFQFSGTLALENQTQTFSLTFEAFGHGETTPEEPDWLDEAAPTNETAE